MGLFRFFRNLSLGVKLNIVVVLVLGLLLIAIVLVTSRSTEDLTAQTGQHRIGQEIVAIQSRFAEAEETVLATTKLLAVTPGLHEAVANKDAAKVTMIIAIDASVLELDDITVVDVNGQRLTIETTEPADTASEDDLLSLALLGIETTGAIIEKGPAGELEFRLAAVTPLRDESGVLIGAMAGSRTVDDQFLKETNFSRADVHLVLIAEKQILAQDLATPERLEEFAPVLLNDAAIGQALSGQALVADDLLYSSGGVPNALAYSPLTVGGATRAVIGIMVDMGELFIFRRQLIINTTIVFTFLALAAVAVIALFAWRSIAVPIGKLQSVAERIASGNYREHAEVTTTDEVGQLASAFNHMTARLRQTLADLEQHTAELAHRATQLQTVAEVARDITATRDLDDLLHRTVNLICDHFGFYHVGTFLLDEAGERAVFRAASSEGGQRLVAQGFKVKVSEESIIGQVASSGQARIALDVSQDAVFFNIPELPYTRSEITVPLKMQDRVIGVLDVQSTEPAAFTEEDVVILQTLADQLAVGLENARLLGQTQTSLDELTHLHQMMTGEAWQQFTQARSGLRRYRAGVVSVPQETWAALFAQARSQGQPVSARYAEGEEGEQYTLAVPVKLRGMHIGVLGFHRPIEAGEWRLEEISLAEGVAERAALALEINRLLDETRHRATRERLVSEITTRIRASTEVDTILQTAIQELGRALRASDGLIWLKAGDEFSSLRADLARANRDGHPAGEEALP